MLEKKYMLDVDNNEPTIYKAPFLGSPNVDALIIAAGYSDCSWPRVVD